MADAVDPNLQDQSGKDGSSQQKPEAEQSAAPLDGVRHPEESVSATEQAAPIKGRGRPPMSRKKLMIIILGCGGAFVLFYVFFGLYLMATFPTPDASGQEIKLLGNMVYGIMIPLSLTGLVLLAVRLLQSGLDPDELPRALIRPVIVVLVLVSFSAMVLFVMNQETPLPIDILEPLNTQNLTAPVSVTFGTETLRSILRKQNLQPIQYQWDFDGDGKFDANTQENEVTTSYKRKGTYRVVLTMQLSNGKIRKTTTVVHIPNAIFGSDPSSPVLEEDVTFDLSNLVSNPASVIMVLWDFNGDGVPDTQGSELTVTHSFLEIGTYQVEVTIQYQGGLQEKYVRPVTVLEEQKQPFEVSIITDGDLQGSAPLGVIFTAKVEAGINVNSIEWLFRGAEQSIDRSEVREGERVSYVFDREGEYRATVRVKDNQRRTSVKMIKIKVLNPLVLSDVVISGIPKPAGKIVEGVAPLEVKLEPASQTPFITFRWEQENASEVFSYDDNYHAVYDKAGTYQVVLIAKDEQERSQKFPMEIRVHPPSSRVEFTAIPATGIAPLTVTFDASQSSVPDGRITGFSWEFGDGGRDERPQLLGAKVSHRYDTEGTFKVVVNALTEEGKSFEARKTIVVRSPTLDACVFPSRTTGVAPMGIRFDTSCSTGSVETYLWDFGDGSTSEQTVPVMDHVFSQPGTYEVKLEVSDGQGSVSEEVISITVLPAR